MSVIDKLKEITSVSDSAADRAKFEKDFSLVPPQAPDMVATPKNRDEVAEVVIVANDNNIPVVPASSKVHFNGGTVPRPSTLMPRPVGMVMDLSGMDSIDLIDEENCWGHLECGVTWEQYASALKEKGYRTTMPLLPHAERSVLIDWLEREQATAPLFEYSEQIGGMWVVWGKGEKFATGSASSNTFGQPGNYAMGVNPQGPGTVDFWRLLQGAQGTLGVVTKGVVKFERIPKIEKTFFLAADELEDLIDPTYEILHRRIGYECFIVNNMTLASMLASKGDEIIALRDKLPAYTMLLVIGGLLRKPEMMIDYQEKYLNTTFKANNPDSELLTSLDGAPGLEEKLPEMLRNPWPKDKTYWKHALKGNCQEIVFMTTGEKSVSFNDIVMPLAQANGFDPKEVGHYIQPVEGGRACQVTYSFYYADADADRMKALYNAAVPAIWNAGGFFNRPYEGIAQVVYADAPDYVKYLMKVKQLFDPNMILSQGKLCF
ncbi:MAG: FAD-binding oxidoreductase [Deltaproteobacteria bacterium]|nr:FAD-binding oxidoreductase [Deltaproteobacteria bacterium]